jgi:rhodanese-related sulfurtransferase
MKCSEPNTAIFVYCQKGIRSAMAVAALKGAGYTQSVSLQGGLEGGLEIQDTIEEGEFGGR